MVRDDESPLLSDIPAPGLLAANTVGALFVSGMSLLALAWGYNRLSGTLWLLAFAGTLAITAWYARYGRDKPMFALALAANAIVCFGCLWGLMILPPFGVILVGPGLWTGTNLICLLSVPPRPQVSGAKGTTSDAARL